MDVRNIPNVIESNQPEITFKSKYSQNRSNSKHYSQTHVLFHECCLIFVFSLSLYLIYAIFHEGHVGVLGDHVASFILIALGKSSLLLPLTLIGVTFLSHRHLIGCRGHANIATFTLLKCVLALLTLLSITSIMSFFAISYGGRVGDSISIFMIGWIGDAGTLFLLGASTLISSSLLTGISWFDVFRKAWHLFANEQQQAAANEIPKEFNMTDFSVKHDPILTDNKHTNYNLSIERRIESLLFDFGIRSEVVGVESGPVISRYELSLAPGVKANQVETLTKDLARALSVKTLRVANVPGKNVLGIEIPNASREVVRLDEILISDIFLQSQAKLPLILGKDIVGKIIVDDLSVMPHLLIAGTTGSGKSVVLNAMLLGLLSQLTPASLQLILFDPKQLELSCFDSVPHLLTPVITDMSEAVGALNWCVKEMENRYRLLQANGARNIDDYNQQANTSLPRIVIVADEFADMMMSVGNDVENSLVMLAQKARAAGIHLILSTQRPTTDIITGLIKSNVPARISLAVSSNTDSRIVLDQSGAEKLLGQGDLLFLPPHTREPMRIQAPL